MLPESGRNLVRLLSKLPTIGERTATRLVLFLLSTDPALSRAIGGALSELRDRIAFCEVCGNFTEKSERSICRICTDPARDPSLLCVVSRVTDLGAIEKSGAMRGRYFVLGRLISPLDGVGPEQLPLDALRTRIEQGVTEVLLATPPSVDGEATALFLSKELSSLGVRLSRIASGVQHGADLEFADQVSIGRAIANRTSFR